MHELSIAENITEIILETAKNAGNPTILKFSLEIGTLSGIETEALQFALDVCLKESPAEKAEREFIIIEGIGKCEECEQESPIPELFSPCSHCGSFRMQIVSGQEMRIKAIEVTED